MDNEKELRIVINKAKTMKKDGINKVSAFKNLVNEGHLPCILKNALDAIYGINKLSFKESERDKWTKYYDSIGGSFTKCAKKLEDKKDIDDPESFCASLKSFVEKKKTGSKE